MVKGRGADRIRLVSTLRLRCLQDIRVDGQLDGWIHLEKVTCTGCVNFGVSSSIRVYATGRGLQRESAEFEGKGTCEGAVVELRAK